MASDGQPVERLREYLRHLKPEARSMLVLELERGLLRGDDNPANQFVLDELRQAIRSEARPVPRIGNAARLFFAPSEPFLFDGPIDHKRVGLIARAALDPIWQWIGRDLMQAEAKALSEDINRALPTGDTVRVEQQVRLLHDRAILKMREALKAISHDERAQRRFTIQVGTPRAVDDVTLLLQILEIRDVLADLAKRLPLHIRAFDREAIEQVKVHLDAVSSSKVSGGATHPKEDVIRYGLVMTMNRMTVPWQLIRVATRAAASDDTARIAETPYGVAVSLALSEVEAAVAELRTEFKAGRSVTSILKELHDAARGLRTEIDLSVDCAWSRQLTAIRAEVSNLLTPELDVTAGRVRRLLRPRAASEITPRSVVDSIDLEEVETRVEVLSACRIYAGELALSEVTLRAYSEVTQYLETGTELLLDCLRRASPTERTFRQSQADAAIRLCRVLFGHEYAGTLAKAADVAAQAAIVEKSSVARA